MPSTGRPARAVPGPEGNPGRGQVDRREGHRVLPHRHVTVVEETLARLMACGRRSGISCSLRDDGDRALRMVQRDASDPAQLQTEVTMAPQRTDDQQIRLGRFAHQHPVRGALDRSADHLGTGMVPFSPRRHDVSPTTPPRYSAHQGGAMRPQPRPPVPACARPAVAIRMRRKCQAIRCSPADPRSCPPHGQGTPHAGRGE